MSRFPFLLANSLRLGTDQLLIDANGQSRISVENYAMAMINEREKPAHIRQRFTVGH
jgi:putative NADH-flavin reductase